MIRTVLDDLDPAQLGATNYHEHLFQVSPRLPGDEIDDEELSGDEAVLLRDSGFQAMVDATPYGLGRNPAALARISAATGLHIVATTGRHREVHYSVSHPTRITHVNELIAQFTMEVTEGMPVDDAKPFGPRALSPNGAPIPAGVLKAGIDYWRIGRFDRISLDAAAAVHAVTATPIMVHLEFCTAAHEVLDILGEAGVSPDRVALAHADRNPDPGLHTDLAQRGAYLGYDGMARAQTRSDAELLALTERVVEAGAAERILLGGDVARSKRYISYGGMPGLGYLGNRYVPRLRAALGDAVVDGILTANPARFLDVP